MGALVDGQVGGSGECALAAGVVALVGAFTDVGALVFDQVRAPKVAAIALVAGVALDALVDIQTMRSEVRLLSESLLAAGPVALEGLLALSLVGGQAMRLQVSLMAESLTTACPVAPERPLTRMQQNVSAEIEAGLEQ